MHVTLANKTLEIRLSKKAERALADYPSPLLVEMELLFSCLIRKRVRFGALTGENAIPASDRLWVRFRPVMTRVCAVSSVADTPPLDDFPIADMRPYVPRWLTIDYRRGEWSGEFGY
jgi:hypothetical protein